MPETTVHPFEARTPKGTRTKLINTVKDMHTRLTLDQFHVLAARHGVMASLDYIQQALEWLLHKGLVKRDGLLHWKRV